MTNDGPFSRSLYIICMNLIQVFRTLLVLFHMLDCLQVGSTACYVPCKCFLLKVFLSASSCSVTGRILHKQTKFSSFSFCSLRENICLEKKAAFFFSWDTSMTKSNEHLHVCFELDFQNKTVVFSSVLAKKQQKKGSNLCNSFGMKNVKLHARVFFFYKSFKDVYPM